MKELLTPKQVAKAIQVSESSIKRWCDKGVIRTQYTAGGHRRIPLNGLLEFLRASNHELVQPEALGLSPKLPRSGGSIDEAAIQFTEALLAGREQQCRQIALDLYLAEHSISSLCDRVFSEAFVEIGRRWECGSAEIYQERLSCEIALRILHNMRSFAPVPHTKAPLAIGGTAEGDIYSIATTMVELVLRDTGWCAVSLGNNLPFRTLSAAIRQNRPKLFWLSCSYLKNEESFIRGYNDLYDEFGRDVAFVVGGRSLSPRLRHRMKFAAYCDNMRHLEGFAQSMLDQEARNQNEQLRPSGSKSDLADTED